MTDDISTVRAPLTRDLVLQTAKEMIEQDGLDALSLRKLASRLGVTAPALYAYVGGKQDLLRAVVGSEFLEMQRRFRDAATEDPIEHIRILSHVYVDYALAHPRLFEAMFLFRPDLFAQTGQDEAPLATETFHFGAGPVRTAIDQGRFTVEDELLASLTIWSAVHGVVTILLAGPGLTKETEQALVDSVVDTVIAGLMRGTLDT